ncbi:hypothetical protein [Desulfosporosinus sp. HMP52]|uniref:hypothetical protein n=1 Tax=Desulfosporosinus sp. HMP52 TaxID=1487923 RepID=UPI001FA70159|nr:hypothetical protein [Desulfosporosinus sp. HMP52]
MKLKAMLISCRKISLLSCFTGLILISFGIGNYVLTHNLKNLDASNKKMPLLLNSGFLEANEAEATLILWIENTEVPTYILGNMPTENWKWNYKELEMKNGKVARMLTGQDILNKEEEIKLFAWYTNMVPLIEKAGGKIYLDERTPEAIDISAYLSQTNADPMQWMLIDNMISSAAYQKNIETTVMAGQDQVNIQILSRGKGSDGRSVLAIPVLLKEF